MRESSKVLGACFLAVLLFVPLTLGDGSTPGLGPLHPSLLDRVELRQMPAVDVEALLEEDAADQQAGAVPLRIGAVSKTHFTPENSGTWEDLPGGDRVWRLRIRSEGAYWLGLGLGVFHLEGDAELRVFDPRQESVLGPYGAGNHKPHGQLWLPLLRGSEAVLELLWPAEMAEKSPRLALSSVSHGYRALFDPQLSSDAGEARSKAFGDSGSCNIDVNCPLGDDWQDEKRGVTRIVFTSGSSQFTCSGSLINNTAGDCRNFYLTANHCLSSVAEATSAIFYFNYEREGCATGTANQNQSVSGSTLRATWPGSDVTLLELDDVPPAEFEAYYNGWNRETSAASESTCIHHPSGDAKKISYNSDPLVGTAPANPNHWRVTEWEQGTTEGGSSGSPLLDQNSRIVGQLHQGTAGCTVPLGWDEYGKFDVSWAGGGTAESRLSDWLDPGGTGSLTVNGIDALTCVGPRPELSYDDHSIQTPSGDYPDAADPGETVVLRVEVENEGLGDATQVTGELSSSTALVSISDSSADWPDILAGQTRESTSPHFTFSLDPNYPCGEPVQFTLNMATSGGADAGSSSLQVAVGTAVVTQLFEDQMESGEGSWSHQELVGSNPWGLSTLFSYSPTHSFRVGAPGSVSDSVLVMVELTELATGAALEFKHRFDTESNADGGVLEYSTDGSSWTDAGSLITSGGYNSTLGTTLGNPLGGREAWSGFSSGWLAVVVDLSGFEGEDLHLRWRHGTDSSVPGVGWFVDDVNVTSTTWFCDNCPTVSNPGQEDFDSDGAGDACESGARLADMNNSARVDGFDLSLIGRAFGANSGQAAYDARADLDQDGIVDGNDLSLMAAQFGGAVGDW